MLDKRIALMRPQLLRLDADENELVVVCGYFNTDLDDKTLEAIRGDVESTGNGQLATRVLIPCERTIPESSRFPLIHQGRGTMLDHLLVSRSLLAFYKGTQGSGSRVRGLWSLFFPR